MKAKTLLTILSFFSIVTLFSCGDDYVTIYPSDRVVNKDTIQSINESVVRMIVDSLGKETEYIRVSPIIEDTDLKQFNFIVGMKDYRLWLNVYDSAWVQVNEHLSLKQTEKVYHLGYGEYGELCDMYLSFIHYDEQIKFLDVYIIYAHGASYAIRYQSLFINNSDFNVVEDSIIGDYSKDGYYHIEPRYIFDYSFDCNLKPHHSSNLLKPWVNNSFLYLFKGNIFCYNLDNYTTIYKSEEIYNKSLFTSFETENAINYEEVIIVRGTESSESDIERFNIKRWNTEWDFFIKEYNLVPQDAKCLSLEVVERRENEWKFAGEWVLFDGTHKKLEFVIDINTGEHLTDNTLS